MKNKRKNQKEKSLRFHKDSVAKLNQEAINGGKAPTTNSSGNTELICCSDLCQFTRTCERQQ